LVALGEVQAMPTLGDEQTAWQSLSFGGADPLRGPGLVQWIKINWGAGGVALSRKSHAWEVIMWYGQAILICMSATPKLRQVKSR
jgi:hypothetical protein